MGISLQSSGRRSGLTVEKIPGRKNQALCLMVDNGKARYFRAVAYFRNDDDANMVSDLLGTIADLFPSEQEER